jgi:hypothetical protein
MASSKDNSPPPKRLLSQNEFDKHLATVKRSKGRPTRLGDTRCEDFDGWPTDSHSEAHLRGAIDEEAKLRKKLRQLIKGPTGPRLKACRAWWKAVQSVLEQYAKVRGKDRPGAPQDSPRLSGELLLALSGIAGYIAEGTTPDPVKWATSDKRGRRAIGPTKSSDISCAVAYLNAAEEGRIKDSQPTQTVMTAFEVKLRTVQEWQKAISALEGSAKASPGIIKRKMRRAARRYCSASHSEKAIERRALKRREPK